MMVAADAVKPVLVLVCTYNERDNLPKLFDQIFAVLPDAEILVVDDGSPDGTSAWVREQQSSNARIHLLDRGGKLGLGTAIRDGMRFAIQRDFEWLINLDGDLSHDPAAIPSLLAFRDRSDLVIGSRYVSGGRLSGCSWRRILVSRTANVLARWIVGWKIRDCSSAYRLYRVRSLETIPIDTIQAKGYGFLEEILALLMRSGARIEEVPIIYTERLRGASKLSIREAFSTLGALIRVRKLARQP